MAVRNRLKFWRHQRQMNQKEFATLLGINASQYNRYELNKKQPTLEMALKMARALGVYVEDIFFIDDDNNDCSDLR